MDNQNIMFTIKRLNQVIANEIISHSNKQKDAPNPTQIRIIDYILEHSTQEVLQKDLEKALKVSRATISDVLRTMEKNELITKLPSKKDSRTYKIVLQKKASDKLENAIKYINDIETKMLKNIAVDDLNTFKIVIGMMIENLDYKK